METKPVSNWLEGNSICGAIKKSRESCLLNWGHLKEYRFARAHMQQEV